MDNFARNSFVILSGSFVISILNFLYYPILARMMNIEEFGEVQTLVTLFTQISMVLMAMTSVAVIIVAKATSSKIEVNFVAELQKLVTYLFIAFGVFVLIFHQTAQTYLQLDSILPLFSLLIGLGLNIPIAFSIAYLQGKEDFKTWNIVGIVGASLKLIVAVGLVYVGWGVTGAIIALFVSQVLLIFYIYRKHKDINIIQAYLKPKLNRAILIKYLPFASTVFIVSLTVGILYSADLIFVKHYLSPEQAGLYSGVSTLGRVIVFATSPFIVVLLPSINSRPTERLFLLKKALLYVVLTGVSCLAVFSLFAGKLVSIVVGDRYVSSAVYLQKITTLFLMIAILNILMYYQVSLKDKRPVYVSLIGLGSLMLQLFYRHNSVDIILNGIIFSVILMLSLMLILMSFIPRLRALRFQR